MHTIQQDREQLASAVVGFGVFRYIRSFWAWTIRFGHFRRPLEFACLNVTIIVLLS